MSWIALFFMFNPAYAGDGVPKRAKASEPHPMLLGVGQVIYYTWRCGVLRTMQCTAYQYINPDGAISPLLGLGGGESFSEPNAPDGTPGRLINSITYAWDLETDESYFVTQDGWVGPFDAPDSQSIMLVGDKYSGAITRDGKQAIFWGVWVGDWHDEVKVIDYGVMHVPYYAYRDGSDWYVVYNPTDPDSAERYGPFEVIGNTYFFQLRGGKPAFTAQPVEGESWSGVWGELVVVGFSQEPSISSSDDDGVYFKGYSNKDVYTDVYVPQDPSKPLKIWYYPGGEDQRQIVNICAALRWAVWENPDLPPVGSECAKVPDPDTFLVELPLER